MEAIFVCALSGVSVLSVHFKPDGAAPLAFEWPPEEQQPFAFENDEAVLDQELLAGIRQNGRAIGARVRQYDVFGLSFDHAMIAGDEYIDDNQIASRVAADRDQGVFLSRLYCFQAMV